MSAQEQQELQDHIQRFFHYLGRSMVSWRTHALLGDVLLLIALGALLRQDPSTWWWVWFGFAVMVALTDVREAYRDRQKRLALVRHTTQIAENHQAEQAWHTPN